MRKTICDCDAACANHFRRRWTPRGRAGWGNVWRSWVVGVGNGIGRDGVTCLAALGNDGDVFSADIGARLSSFEGGVGDGRRCRLPMDPPLRHH